MTAVDDRLATVTPLRRTAHRAPRVTPPVPDLHARFLAEANRLLNAAATSESTAEDALSGFVGALINLLPPGGRSPSKHDLIDALGRVADSLGVPAVKAGGAS